MRKEIIKCRDQSNRKQEKANKTRAGSVKRSMKLASKTDKEKEKIQMINMRTETGNITTQPTDIKRIVREYYNHQTHKFDNLSEMDHFFIKHKPP